MNTVVECLQSPGYVSWVLVVGVSSYYVAKNGHIVLQIAMCILATSYIINGWARGDFYSTGMIWFYVGWLVFLTQKYPNWWNRIRFSLPQFASPPRKKLRTISSDKERLEKYQKKQKEYQKRHANTQ